MQRVNELPEYAARCLACACANPANEAAHRLLRFTRARSRAGILAAAFVADAEQWETIAKMTRAAIAEERHECIAHHPRNHRCALRRRRTRS